MTVEISNSSQIPVQAPPEQPERKMRYLDHSPKTVALVGMGPSITDIMNELLTQEASPEFADEVWAINMAANIIRHDLVIWMDDLVDQEAFKPGLFQLLRRYGSPVLTTVSYRNVVPNSYDYPISEVCKMSIPMFGKPYLNNGVAQAIGYALYKGVKKLKIYGCDFTYPNRNFAETGRACVEAWIALASFHGMEVALSPLTSLYDTCDDHGIYGYKYQPTIDMPDGTKFRYVKPDEVNRGMYVPEDSSPAARNTSDEPVSAPTTGGTGSPANLNGGGSPAGYPVAAAAPSPTP